jgi:flagellar basal-body rod protein FlgF
MFTGLYTAASGILSHQREIDTIGNNLVNADTPGYRADRVVLSSFEKELLTRMDGNKNSALGTDSGSMAVVVNRIETLTNGGTLNPTGRALDAAISGNGYFTVQGNDGNTYYTRNGNFEMDKDGYLSITGLGRVLGKGGPIHLDSAQDLTILNDGTIYDGTGKALGALKISDVPQGTVIEKLENGSFRVKGGGAMGDAAGYTVYQNTLELSNVDQNQEMTMLIRAQRAYQTCSSALQVADEMDQKASTQIASV